MNAQQSCRGNAPKARTHDRYSTLDRVRTYIGWGWTPVPIPSRAKAPRVRGWPTLRITDADVPHYFSCGQNVGIILGAASNGLTDVDIDCVEAIELAAVFLPATDAVFGRAGKPRSHRLYRVDGAAPTLKLSDPISGDMLLEIRGDGGLQTVFPGSIHPSGELIEWDANGQPTTIDGSELVRRAKWLAAACLVRRYCGRVNSYASMLAALDAADQRVARQVREWFGMQPANPSNSLNGAVDDHDWIRGPKPEYLTTSPASVSEKLRLALDETQWSPANEARLRSALSVIPAVSRDIWLRVGMALHATGWANAFELWGEWSRTCPEKYDEANQRKTWDGFHGPREGASITLGTVYHLAREHGWTEDQGVGANGNGPETGQPNDGPNGPKDGADRRPPDFMSAAELRTMRFAPVRYVLPEFVPEG